MSSERVEYRVTSKVEYRVTSRHGTYDVETSEPNARELALGLTKNFPHMAPFTIVRVTMTETSEELPHA